MRGLPQRWPTLDRSILSREQMCDLKGGTQRVLISVSFFHSFPHGTFRFSRRAYPYTYTSYRHSHRLIVIPNANCPSSQLRRNLRSQGTFLAASPGLNWPKAVDLTHPVLLLERPLVLAQSEPGGGATPNLESDAPSPSLNAWAYKGIADSQRLVRSLLVRGLRSDRAAHPTLD